MAMELSAASAAARQQAPPGFFTFVKHGAVLPAQNSALFVPLLVLTAALAAALLLGNALSVQPLAAAVLLDADAISRIDPASAAYRELVRAFQSDLRRLLLAGDGCLLGAVVAGARRGQGQLLGPHTDRRVRVHPGAGLRAAIVALAVLAVVLLDYSLLLLFLDALLALLASLFLVYLTVVCSIAVAVFAAEPGRRGAGAVGRAWRLMRGQGAQAAVYVVATCALGAAVSPVYTLMLSCWPRSAISGVAAGVVYVLLLGAVEVFSMVAVTAYYLECRECVEEVEEIMAGHRYIKLPVGMKPNI
uniref:Uncharacterized protein n=1 Tax=Zea mays TaxID=4577 RepID=A0A804REA5_MAIZE